MLDQLRDPFPLAKTYDCNHAGPERRSMLPAVPLRRPNQTRGILQVKLRDLEVIIIIATRRDLNRAGLGP